MDSDEERNALTLRRTLSALSWLYALWSALIAMTAWGGTTQGPYDAPLLTFHAALLGLAGTLLWKPRRGFLIASILAAAGSIFFVTLDLRRHSVQSALIDGAYVALAAALLYKSRRTP